MITLFTNIIENVISRGIKLLDEPALEILFILVVIWSVGVLFQRFNLPLILGELLAGLIIGPPLLGLIQPSVSLTLLAELGAIFLMFFAGLETKIEKFSELTKVSFWIALGGTLMPLVLGTVFILSFGGTFFEAIFIGTAISTTSMVTKARILHELDLTSSKIGHTIMGAAMYDNIFSLILFTLLISTGRIGIFNPVTLVVTLTEIIIFVIVVLFIGRVIYPKVGHYFARRQAKGFTFALIMAFFFGILAELIGLHVILGAYLAGLFVREEIISKTLYQKMYDRFYAISYGFLGPIFFLSLSFHVSFKLDPKFLYVLLALLFAAVFGKVFGAGIGAISSKFNWREALTIGFGMNGRGMFELIFVLIGIKLGILSGVYITILVLIAILTTLMTPIALQICMKTLLPRMFDFKRIS